MDNIDYDQLQYAMCRHGIPVTKCHTCYTGNLAAISPADDNINHPSWYNTGKTEVIDLIEDQQLSFHLGNAVKYICRAGKKNATLFTADLKKAIWYIQRVIEMTERAK